MASILRVNTLTDASSNNSVATSTVFNGTAKLYFNLNGETFGLTSRTFNITSATDSGTGDHQVAISSAMSDAIYPVVGIAGDPASKLIHIHMQDLSAKTASVLTLDTYVVSNTTGGGDYNDAEYIYVVGHGDLA